MRPKFVRNAGGHLIPLSAHSLTSIRNQFTIFLIRPIIGASILSYTESPRYRSYPMPPPHQLTPAQLAIQAERKALKQAKKAAAQASSNSSGSTSAPTGTEQDDRSRFLIREWVSCGSTNGSRATRTRIVTWNVCLLAPNLYWSIGGVSVLNAFVSRRSSLRLLSVRVVSCRMHPGLGPMS